jgi:hypothetical protein
MPTNQEILERARAEHARRVAIDEEGARRSPNYRPTAGPAPTLRDALLSHVAEIEAQLPEARRLAMQDGGDSAAAQRVSQMDYDARITRIEIARRDEATEVARDRALAPAAEAAPAPATPLEVARARYEMLRERNPVQAAAWAQAMEQAGHDVFPEGVRFVAQPRGTSDGGGQ